MAAKQAMKENLQCTSKYGHLRISQDICHVRMTDIEGFLTMYGHSDNLLNNKYMIYFRRIFKIKPFCDIFCFFCSNLEWITLQPFDERVGGIEPSLCLFNQQTFLHIVSLFPSVYIDTWSPFLESPGNFSGRSHNLK